MIRPPRRAALGLPPPAQPPAAARPGRHWGAERFSSGLIPSSRACCRAVHGCRGSNGGGGAESSRLPGLWAFCVRLATSAPARCGHPRLACKGVWREQACCMGAESLCVGPASSSWLAVSAAMTARQQHWLSGYIVCVSQHVNARNRRSRPGSSSALSLTHRSPGQARAHVYPSRRACLVHLLNVQRAAHPAFPPACCLPAAQQQQQRLPLPPHRSAHCTGRASATAARPAPRPAPRCTQLKAPRRATAAAPQGARTARCRRCAAPPTRRWAAAARSPCRAPGSAGSAARRA